MEQQPLKPKLPLKVQTEPKAPAAQPDQKELQKTDLLKTASASMILDTYDDIFSDFDPRPYKERVISDDFLSEAKKETLEHESGRVLLQLMIPQAVRNESNERLIIERLRAFHKSEAIRYDKEISKTRLRGVFLIIGGAILNVIAALLSRYAQGHDNFMMSLLVVIMEPAGWFTVWSGFDQVFFSINTKKPDRDFHARMSASKITFLPY
jgi:hypothetical protein